MSEKSGMQGEAGWKKVKDRIKELVPDSIYKVWFDALKGEVHGNNLFIEVPNEFTRAWIKENYQDLLNNLAKEFKFQKVELRVSEIPRAEQLIIPYNPVKLIGRPLSPRYTFEDFVVGKCNQFAYNVCYQVAEDNPGGYFIYLYGNFGLGKTHLTQAVGNALFKKGLKNVYYLTAQDFLNLMVKYLRSGMIENFKEKFRQDCEVLLLEGIHFFSGKEFTQNELSLILDYLLENGKTVIFTSLKLPQDLPQIDSSLRSRLSSGLIIRLNNPDFTTRKKIIKHKAKKLGYNLPYEVTEFLARNLRGDIRQIESAVLGLIARATLLKEPISIYLAKELIEELGIGGEEQSQVDVVIETACKFFGISKDELFSSSRKKEISLSRQVVMYLLKTYLNKSLKEISQIFKKQHSTIIYNLKTLKNKLSKNSSLKVKVSMLCREVEAELFGKSEFRGISEKSDTGEFNEETDFKNTFFNF